MTAAHLPPVPRRWHDPEHLCVVAATGPSLTPEVADMCRGHDVVAVNDAWRLIPWAVAVYACDNKWWSHHKGVPEFTGEKWSSHGPGANNDKRRVAREYGVRLVAGRNEAGFSTDPTYINHGKNSGFQAINLAMHFGARRIVLVGFDMSVRQGKRHFFGDHPQPLGNFGDYRRFVPEFDRAAKMLPPWLQIINATPGSALKCFPYLPLAEALAERRVEAAE